jgi:TetR/AcrR family transcriptional repressor of nem operon
MGRTSDADERLKDAALDLMWEGSYGTVTIDDICTRAGVKKGSFYYFFASKAELAVAALEKWWAETLKPAMDQMFSPSVEPLGRLTAYLESIYDRQVEVRKKTGKVLGCPICSVGSEISTCEIDVSAKIREIVSRKRRYYDSAIRDAIVDGSIAPCDSVQMATALAGLIDGLISQARIMDDPEIMKGLPAMGLGLLGAKKKSQPTATALAT